MIDTKIFGEKLRHHRISLSLTQQAVAERIGVTPQAVSKWEAGECLPDCFNLKSLGEVYGVSLDILMETGDTDSISVVAHKIGQIADEFVWTKQTRDVPNVHRDLGGDLWAMWKEIFFCEVGNRELQKKERDAGNLRVSSEYGLKIWDDDGVACVVQSALREKLTRVTDRELSLLAAMCSPEGFRLLSLLDPNTTTPKEQLLNADGIEEAALNALLLRLIESKVIEFDFDNAAGEGYKICARYGIAAYMVLAAAYILSKPNCTVSEYLTQRT